MTIASPGIGANLDVNSIVSQLMQIESQPLTKLAQKEASYQAKLTAYGSLTASLSTFQTQMSALSTASRYAAVTATPSDATVLTASAANNATPGTYSIEVTALAKQQKLVADGSASLSTAIAAVDTTLTFDFGTISGTLNPATNHYDPGATFASAGGGTKTVSITAANSSLSDIRDAINAADIGVTATIVNDGSATVPYRLVLTSDTPGAASSMKISVSGDAAIDTLLANDPEGVQNLSENVTAQNASLEVDGLTVSKASNTVTDVVPGVTLNLLQTNVADPITLTTTRDTSAVQTAAQTFVDAYNALAKNLKGLTYYDATTEQAGALQGDSTARSVDSAIRLTLSTALDGAGGYTNLSELGIGFEKDGTLSLDTDKLSTAISNNSDDIAAVFAQTGRATDGLITYSSGTSDTTPGSYAISISQLATHGDSVGSGAVGSLTIDGTNDTLEVTLDGISATVTLAHSTYPTATALAQEVQSAINSITAFATAGSSVTASASGGSVITITSSKYGSSSTVSVTGGNGLANLLGAPTETAGLNVAGTIGGAPATGSGQYLTGATGSPAEGLKLLVSGGTTGARGTAYYSNGYAYQLGQVVSRYIGTDGLITNRTDGINSSITDIDKQRDALTLRLAAIEERYRAQFTALDTLMSSLRNTSSFLTQQLALLPSNSSSSSNN